VLAQLESAQAAALEGLDGVAAALAAAADDDIPAGATNRHTERESSGVTQRAAMESRESYGLARGDRKWPLNEGRIPNIRGVREALGTSYSRVEGNRRASRIRLEGDLPPEIRKHFDSASHRPGPCDSPRTENQPTAAACRGHSLTVLK
jgi:hypothetical protein